MIKAPVIVLKDGTDTSQGTGQLLSNISACMALVDTIKTTLGPRGMDKLMVTPGAASALITNDGATIMKALDVVHPAARALVDIARAQDAQVGDGTTSVVVLAGEILRALRPFIEDGVAPQAIIRALRIGLTEALAVLDTIAVKAKDKDQDGEWLQKCAGTAMNSKLIHHQKGFFAKMVVQAVMSLGENTMDAQRMIGMKKVPGGALQDSLLVDGVAFEKTFSYAGFEQQPKCFSDSPKIALLNIELELKAERDNAEVRIDRVSEYQAVVDAEWRILYTKLEAIAASGAKVVLSRLPIGDVATQFFADRDIFCAGRVQEEDMERVAAAVGGTILTSLHSIAGSSSSSLPSSSSSSSPSQLLGTCSVFEERQVGGKRMNVFSGCPQARTCTIILRGGSEQYLGEVERSLNDAIMIVRRSLSSNHLIAGGGAAELEIAGAVRRAALSIPGAAQPLVSAYAQAFECIPRQLCDNAGLDPIDILARLRKLHAEGNLWHGVDIESGVGDMWDAGVWEPVVIKRNMVASATEAAISILSIDLTIRAAPAVDQGSLGKMAKRAGIQ